MAEIKPLLLPVAAALALTGACKSERITLGTIDNWRIELRQKEAQAFGATDEKTQSSAETGRTTEVIEVDRDGGWVTPSEIRQIQRIPTGPKSVARRAGAIRELGLPYRQLPATAQSAIVYEYRISTEHPDDPGDVTTRFVVGFKEDGTFTGSGFRFGYTSLTDPKV